MDIQLKPEPGSLSHAGLNIAQQSQLTKVLTTVLNQISRADASKLFQEPPAMGCMSIHQMRDKIHANMYRSLAEWAADVHQMVTFGLSNYPPQSEYFHTAKAVLDVLVKACAKQRKKISPLFVGDFSALDAAFALVAENTAQTGVPVETNVAAYVPYMENGPDYTAQYAAGGYAQPPSVLDTMVGDSAMKGEDMFASDFLRQPLVGGGSERVVLFPFKIEQPSDETLPRVGMGEGAPGLEDKLRFAPLPTPRDVVRYFNKKKFRNAHKELRFEYEARIKMLCGKRTAEQRYGVESVPVRRNVMDRLRALGAPESIVDDVEEMLSGARGREEELPAAERGTLAALGMDPEIAMSEKETQREQVLRENARLIYNLQLQQHQRTTGVISAGEYEAEGELARSLAGLAGQSVPRELCGAEALERAARGMGH